MGNAGFGIGVCVADKVEGVLHEHAQTVCKAVEHEEGRPEEQNENQNPKANVHADIAEQADALFKPGEQKDRHDNAPGHDQDNRDDKGRFITDNVGNDGDQSRDIDAHAGHDRGEQGDNINDVNGFTKTAPGAFFANQGNAGCARQGIVHLFTVKLIGEENSDQCIAQVEYRSPVKQRHHGSLLESFHCAGLNAPHGRLVGVKPLHACPGEHAEPSGAGKDHTQPGEGRILRLFIAEAFLAERSKGQDEYNDDERQIVPVKQPGKFICDKGKDRFQYITGHRRVGHNHSCQQYGKDKRWKKGPAVNHGKR